MNEGFLSQEEINSLLNGAADTGDSTPVEEFTIEERDMLGEIGNISMGSASTALSKILNQPVNITTPQVDVVTLDVLKQSFETPNLALNIEYVTGLGGENILVLKVDDASIIANLMMGGDGTVLEAQLTELEISAVSEAMNQMMGSAATSMATMLSREVNISPPTSKVWDTENLDLGESIEKYDEIVRIQFDLTVGTLIHSTIMQIYPVNTAKQICKLFKEVMNGEDSSKEIENTEEPLLVQNSQSATPQTNNTGVDTSMNMQQQIPMQNNMGMAPNVEVQNAQFGQLQPQMVANMPSNIDLILDVPLEVSVVLGRTKKSIKEILALTGGSLIELDKLAEEPVEILVNGKKIAFGEVVVIDENFGVRITSIVSSEERIKTLGKN